jgi:hypothetical protein
METRRAEPQSPQQLRHLLDRHDHGLGERVVPRLEFGNSEKG